jgi:hypothetical protein
MQKRYLNKAIIFSLLNKTKMKKAKEIFQREGLRIHYEKRLSNPKYTPPTLYRSITIFRKKQEIARFEITGDILNNTKECFGSGSTCCMSIGIDSDCPEYKGIQLSRIMVFSLLNEIMRENIYMNYFVYIDVDASGGFWDSIGMEINKNMESSSIQEGRGFEKKIKLHTLYEWASM